MSELVIRGVNAARSFAASLLRADRSTKKLIAVATDIVCCALAVLFSFSLRLGYWDLYSTPILATFVIETVLFIPIFYFSGIYSNLFRFHGTRGMTQLALACAGLAIPSIVIFGFLGWPGVPRTVSAIFPIVFFALVALSRILARYILLELVGERRGNRAVLIFGAGSAGRQLALSIAYEQDYRLVGYIDDDPVLGNSRLEGIPIFHPDKLGMVLGKFGVEIVFLAMPSLSRDRRTALVENLQAHNVHVLTLPGLSEIVDGRVSVSDLREIDVTDLLSRDPVAPDPVLLSKAIEGKTVLVTGAGGSIGSELSRQILRLRPRRIVLVEMTESALYTINEELVELAEAQDLSVDIIPELCSIERAVPVERIFNNHQPHTVYHAAAYKHVPMVEANIVSGVSNNVRGTLNCALAACANDVERFILVSTDKAVRPTNVMGASKRVCELILQALSREDKCRTIFSMVRFGNVLGSSGSVVPRFREQIAAGGPVSLTHPDITRYFMTIPEAAELVIQAGTMADGGEVYLLDMGDPVKISDLALTMIRLSGRSVRNAQNPSGDIEIIETGLRPGEKLYEELLIDASAQDTRHARIFCADEDHLGWAKLERELGLLDQFARDGDGEMIRAKLQDLVPGFGPAKPVEAAAVPLRE